MFVYQTKNPVVIKLFSYEKLYLFQEICIAANQVIKNDLY